MMELSLPSSSSLSTLNLSPLTSFSTFHSPLNPLFPFPFHTRMTRKPPLTRIHNTHRNISKRFVVLGEHEQFWLSDEEEQERVYDSEDDDSLYLSLSEKPDRNMALLDDYEMEELHYAPNPNHRSGYVAVLGKPNVGKSTLANQMIGQKLSIVSDKPQTTRHRILGICSGPEYQMILYDTPGVIEKKMHKLDTMMMRNVRSAAVNADCVLVLVDACKVPGKIDEVLEEGLGNLESKLPTLLVLNKKDLIKPGEIATKLQWYQQFTDVDDVIPVSAKYGHGVEDVKEWILSKLPIGPAYYPKACLSELIRIDVEPQGPQGLELASGSSCPYEKKLLAITFLETTCGLNLTHNDNNTKQQMSAARPLMIKK